jgi:acetyl-CoA carboxylase biotin carboxylase subunit
MNTRLQVEHPVTEMVTGLDLVELQLRVAAGEPLPFTQEDVRWTGSAMECRVYAEDPETGFLPSPGRIERWAPPSGPGIRLDSGAYPGWTVPSDYDPMLAKLAAWGSTREQATRRLQTALREFEITGIRTNLAYFAGLLGDAEFVSGRLHTGFIPQYEQRRMASKPGAGADFEGLSETVLKAIAGRPRHSSAPVARVLSRWASLGRAEQLR